jgi:hypothetical protein
MVLQLHSVTRTVLGLVSVNVVNTHVLPGLGPGATQIGDQPMKYRG